MFLLSACQVYKSGGRSMFENAATPPPNSVGNTTFPILAEPNCWIQPSADTLWLSKSDLKYQVRFVDDGETAGQNIEVCIEESEPAASDRPVL